ncbi:cytochrome c biogenesis CcdA family protein [Allobranchiibius sp. GilTou73]|uniref:cytochrome c biogenesis CcdA family protein n=1 Tax=Allobranchiibius sp. GilTou73 TaxID=2904523 RepID=UPI001F29DF80|nr:cytochrome c biogenesis protein CcdA [Allobranchiibius sp. GilTou73]UIJ36465.1 cytochrome c biogenesis protein CcdA [Allobranchiibius sp. GilTou73]
MSADVQQVVATGSLPLAVGLALVAGLVSFASPCVLPLVPGFLAYVTGLTDERRRTRLVSGALLFVLGFGVVLVGISIALNWALDLTRNHLGLVTRVGGVVVILLALVYLGFIGQRGLPVSWRPAAGLLGAPLLGVVFGLGMSPCVGPVYGAIQVAAAPLGHEGGPVPRGVLLAVCYTIGLGIPFVLIAAGWSRAERASRWLRDHHRAVQLVGGTLMLIVGVLMVSGLWEDFVAWIQTQLVGNGAFEPAI